MITFETSQSVALNRRHCNELGWEQKMRKWITFNNLFHPSTEFTIEISSSNTFFDSINFCRWKTRIYSAYHTHLFSFRLNVVMLQITSKYTNKPKGNWNLTPLINLHMFVSFRCRYATINLIPLEANEKAQSLSIK